MLKITHYLRFTSVLTSVQKSNYVCAGFYKNKYINSSFANNNQPNEELALKILECLKEHPDITRLLQL